MKTIQIIFLQISKKLLETRKKGLYQYRNYLFAQLEYASQSSLRSCYKDYVQKQVALNDRQLANIEQKLSTLR